ncbi:hypothetical protein [Microcoleus sp. Pol14C6]|uniref:hypothetical protein n=1 Tax=Microcoleus sp. Pol14C6 TaxID=3055399 RepID=UPI002FD5EFF5
MAVSQLMRVGLVSIIGDRTCDRFTGLWPEILCCGEKKRERSQYLARAGGREFV